MWNDADEENAGFWGWGNWLNWERGFWKGLDRDTVHGELVEPRLSVEKRPSTGSGRTVVAEYSRLRDGGQGGMMA
ncbi:hypothetical protein [Parasphingorhabdus sp.]|uniref:hypothetical protein n=1 Tax=Parasphingorhabdus sp. TaxID=2709688 RepID=UPI003D29EC15